MQQATNDVSQMGTEELVEDDLQVGAAETLLPHASGCPENKSSHTARSPLFTPLQGGPTRQRGNRISNYKLLTHSCCTRLLK